MTIQVRDVVSPTKDDAGVDSITDEGASIME